MKPDRPPLIHFAGVRELYLHFERIFLNNSGVGEINLSCGHHIKIFDHHFFHMVKLDDPTKAKPLLMVNEKAIILATELGFGTYMHDKQRAIYLESAMSCLGALDEIWEDHTLNSATWVCIKEFNAKPYAFTITLVAEREDSLVPVTSFPEKKEMPKDGGEDNESTRKNTSGRPFWERPDDNARGSHPLIFLLLESCYPTVEPPSTGARHGASFVLATPNCLF